MFCFAFSRFPLSGKYNLSWWHWLVLLIVGMAWGWWRGRWRRARLRRRRAQGLGEYNEHGHSPLRNERAYPENTPGAFYVACNECISCRAPESVAPDLIGWYEDPSGTGRESHCYFKKQPETEGEIDRAIKAVSANCCGSYRYAGSDSRIKRGLRKAGCDFAIEKF